MVNCLDDVEKPSKMCAGFNSVEDNACKKRVVGIWEAEAKMRGSSVDGGSSRDSECPSL